MSDSSHGHRSSDEISSEGEFTAYGVSVDQTSTDGPPTENPSSAEPSNEEPYSEFVNSEYPSTDCSLSEYQLCECPLYKHIPTENGCRPCQRTEDLIVEREFSEYPASEDTATGSEDALSNEQSSQYPSSEDQSVQDLSSDELSSEEAVEDSSSEYFFSEETINRDMYHEDPSSATSFEEIEMEKVRFSKVAPISEKIVVQKFEDLSLVVHGNADFLSTQPVTCEFTSSSKKFV